jgi:hypothetical protein
MKIAFPLPMLWRNVDMRRSITVKFNHRDRLPTLRRASPAHSD